MFSIDFPIPLALFPVYPPDNNRRIGIFVARKPTDNARHRSIKDNIHVSMETIGERGDRK
ncbi:MAG TPA: hypothetical protein VK944_03325 [Candidatus Limnocylindria bacterium]|jgi:hypothetical protein|nr:hypothetical protein [Candidatus Limnocylindria bacterium]